MDTRKEYEEYIAFRPPAECPSFENWLKSKVETLTTKLEQANKINKALRCAIESISELLTPTTEET